MKFLQKRTVAVAAMVLAILCASIALTSSQKYVIFKQFFFLIIIK